MPYNNIQHVLTDAQKNDLLLKIAQIKSDLPFLVNLTPGEKQAGKNGQDKYAFVQAGADYAASNPDLLPPAMPLSQWQKDIELYNALMPVFGQLKKLYESVEDTIFALRIEMNKAGVDFMKIAELAANSNRPGAKEMVADLKSKLNKPYKARKEKV